MVENTCFICLNEINDDDGNTALKRAVNRGHTEMVNILLERGADPNYKTTNESEYPLIEACIRNNTKIVKMLVDNGADMTVRDSEEDLTPLHLVSSNGNIELVQFFLDKGADVNSNTDDGPTALMTACINEHTNIVKMLINNGADINRQDNNNGATPLIEASFRDNPEIVSLLLENGADVNIIDKWGDSAITKAIEYENTEVVTLIKNHINKIVSLIIKKGRTKDEIPLLPNSHKDIVYRVLSFI